jgi:hypothetical protein
MKKHNTSNVNRKYKIRCQSKDNTPEEKPLAHMFNIGHALQL